MKGRRRSQPTRQPPEKVSSGRSCREGAGDFVDGTGQGDDLYDAGQGKGAYALTYLDGLSEAPSASGLFSSFSGRIEEMSVEHGRFTNPCGGEQGSEDRVGHALEEESLDTPDARRALGGVGTPRGRTRGTSTSGLRPAGPLTASSRERSGPGGLAWGRCRRLRGQGTISSVLAWARGQLAGVSRRPPGERCR